MTDTVHVDNPETTVRAFRAHLSPALASYAHPTAAITRAVWVAVTERGWTPRQLAKECETALDNTRPGAVITHRLRQAAVLSPLGSGDEVLRPPRLMRACRLGPEPRLCRA